MIVDPKQIYFQYDKHLVQSKKKKKRVSYMTTDFCCCTTFISYSYDTSIYNLTAPLQTVFLTFSEERILLLSTKISISNKKELNFD